MKSESKFEGQLGLSRARHSAAVLGSSAGMTRTATRLGRFEAMWQAWLASLGTKALRKVDHDDTV